MYTCCFTGLLHAEGMPFTAVPTLTSPINEPLMPTSPPITTQHLAYSDQLDSRPIEEIELVVIHATETPDLNYARQLAEEVQYLGSGTGNSGHYYVDLDGTCYEYVPPERVAHHVSGHNKNSIGIELVNLGRYPLWFHTEHQTWTSTYPDVQLNALLELLRGLKARYPQLKWLARHSDLDRRWIPAADRPEQLVARKLDPGSTFPWDRLLQEAALSAYSEPDQ